MMMMVRFNTAKRLGPDVTTYTTMIKGLCRQGLLGDATKLLKEMADNGCPPNERTYNTILQGFLKASDIATALDHHRVMRRQGFAADAHTASLFLGLLTARNVGDKDKALLQKHFLDYEGEEKREGMKQIVIGNQEIE
ncbi:pentatricopeptide repeat-containing protein At1g63150-like isoform X4 [Silene latifolia]|uniref:pentatricopeptide repeat-containing protein At1g63150-like isoform X4 n=1 Tax=Silene latifolia TaxID=37657 RepID=UPI003D7717FB